ncbi:MAG: hypothetical protein N2738_00230, partial [Thermodesulfovibrionales bacterium]|nr:hypothetical protein [Thermodesulfovibrionales bacterium]
MSKSFFTPDLEEIVTTDELFDTFDVDSIEPEVLLFQAGYLTIKEYESTEEGIYYKLSYPNKEVRVALNKSIFAYLINNWKEAERGGYEIANGIKGGDIGKVERMLRSVFASIPYEWYRNCLLYTSP